jgi:hypothetical protein
MTVLVESVVRVGYEIGRKKSRATLAGFSNSRRSIKHLRFVKSKSLHLSARPSPGRAPVRARNRIRG